MRLLWLFAALGLARANPLAVPTADEPNYRLDTNVAPSSYNIELTLENDFATSQKFTGKTTINFAVEGTKQKSIRLHKADELKIDSAKIILKDKDQQTITFKYGYDKTTQIMELTTTYVLPAGQYSLEFEEFEGKLYDDMYGFYLSSYKEGKNIETIATTQFQATHARRAFPCFDEPQFKAKFTISIIHPKAYQALGNQPPAKQPEIIGDKIKTTFKETIKMSTYIVAFVVSKFKSTESSQIGNTENKYHIWARKEATTSMTFATEETPKLMQKLDEFMKIKYFDNEMKQLDQVAIPDFAAGAMENWGLLTFRETALLWDNKDATTKNKQRVSSVMAHEQSHMWFGDLVTMKWWEDAWLNEGFARFFEYFTTGEVHTDWEMMDQFVVEQMHAVFPLDAVTSQALSNKVNSPNEIESNFGSITYNKGGCIVRMMQHWLGENEFKTALQNYLDANKLLNTVPTDLFVKLGQGMDKNMKEWVWNPGFPVVNVSYSHNKIVFGQERFDYDRFGKKEKAGDSTLWKIPITYTTSKNINFMETTPNFVLDTANIEREIPLDAKDWIVFNLKQTGYYRVNYDGILLGKIHEALNKDVTVIHKLNRAQIVDDMLNLARGGYKTYKETFDFIDYLKKETDYYPWYTAFNSFSYLRKRLSGTVKNDLTDYMLELMAALYKNVEFDNTPDNHVDKLKRVLAFQWACELGDKTCIDKSKNAYTKYMENAKPVEPDMRSVVYCAAIRDGNEAHWEFLYSKLKDPETVAHENATIITALGCTNKDVLQKQYLKYSIDGSIRKQDAQNVFNAVITGNPSGVDLSLDFLIESWSKIHDKYGSMNALSNVINTIAERITSEAQLKKFNDFLKDNVGNLEDATEDVINAAIATANNNKLWVEKYEGELTTWFNKYYRGSAAGLNASLALIAVFAIISRLLQ